MLTLSRCSGLSCTPPAGVCRGFRASRRRAENTLKEVKEVLGGGEGRSFKSTHSSLYLEILFKVKDNQLTKVFEAAFNMGAHFHQVFTKTLQIFANLRVFPRLQFSNDNQARNRNQKVILFSAKLCFWLEY